MISQGARADFTELVASLEDGFQLDRAALLIAAEEYPELPIDCYVVELDVLAQRVVEKLHPDAGPHEVLRRMRHVLVEQEGFSGNPNDYYDPRNSYLNDVLDRRVGIPIALSTVYLEIARRIGFPLHGVGFPGHFLIKHPGADGDIVIDPFHGGKVLEHRDLECRIQTMFKGRVKNDASLLDPVTPRQLLFRMLGNLKSIYIRAGDSTRALAAVERMILLSPSHHREQRDRGVLLTRLDRPLEALQALALYRKLVPQASDAERVDSMLEDLRRQVGMAN